MHTGSGTSAADLPDPNRAERSDVNPHPPMRAMILAAGRGQRMGTLTDILPKPLLAAGGKPLIVWLIEALVRERYRELVINISHHGAQIEQALGDGRRFGASIAYSREAEALETAGGIAYALPLLGEHPFLVVNGDLGTDFPFARLRGALATGVRAHLVLVRNPAHHPNGDFGLAGVRVTRDEHGRHTYSGIGVFDPALFRAIRAGTRCPLAAVLGPAIDAGRVTGELYPGRWMDVGTPERLAALDRLLRAS
jgi:N-acetyl-alpha-D-muramate 1-phosphate uridylyltransferase